MMQPETLFAIAVDGAAVGGIGFYLQKDVERVSAEIGYWLGERFWGRGIASEAIVAMTRYAFDHHELTRLYALVAAGNPRLVPRAREGRLRARGPPAPKRDQERHRLGSAPVRLRPGRSTASLSPDGRSRRAARPGGTTLALRRCGMTSANQDTVYDVVIVGGGPAGSCSGPVARPLGAPCAPARAHRRSERAARPSRFLRAPASFWRRSEVLDAVDRVAFAPNRGNVVWWASAAPRFESFRPWPGRLAGVPAGPRSRPAGLRTACRRRCSDRRDGEGRPPRRERVDARSSTKQRATHAPRPRASWPTAPDAPASWPGAAFGAPSPLTACRPTWAGGTTRTLGSPDDDRTLVETYDDGWAWSLPASPAIRQVAVDGRWRQSRRTRGSRWPKP